MVKKKPLPIFDFPPEGNVFDLSAKFFVLLSSSNGKTLYYSVEMVKKRAVLPLLRPLWNQFASEEPVRVPAPVRLRSLSGASRSLLSLTSGTLIVSPDTCGCAGRPTRRRGGASGRHSLQAN